jgi:hypothetical protein
MARIRIVDEWIRSPAALATHARSIMVVAEKWAEQRVLMRAYADSRDQTRPTIFLHEAEYAIGPAGIDAQGPWGIHVPTAAPGASHDDGAAQALRDQLEHAARRLAGSRGNPPRLADEESTFDRVPTGNWTPSRAGAAASASAVRMRAQASTIAPHGGVAEVVSGTPVPPQPVVSAAPSASGNLRRTPVPRPGNRRTSPPTSHHRTALGYQSGAGAQSALVRLGLLPSVSERLGRLATRTVSVDFQVTRLERTALNAIGERPRATGITAHELGALLGVADPVGWMEELTSKLERYGVDILEPGEPRGGEPTYVLKE